MMIESLIEDQEDIVLFIEHVLKENNQNIDEDRIRKISTRILYNLIRRMNLATIGKVTLALGSKKLISTFESVAVNRSITSVRLIQIAIKLEYLRDFPYKEVEELYKNLEGNIIGLDLLKLIVQRYLYMFPTTTSQKQKICALVNLQLNANHLLTHGQALKV